MNDIKQVPIGDFRFTDEMRANFEQIFRSGRVTYGPFLREFEHLFAEAHQRKYGIFCVSGTSALQVALKTLRTTHGWQDGDEILIPALTFVASSNVVLHERLRPVFLEVDQDFYGVDPDRIEERITERTRAIMPVHLFGMPCRMDKIEEIAQRHNLVILEDACQCTNGKIDGRSVGTWGPMSCFSTYCGSIVFTGVGGLVLTDDEDLMVHARKLLAHGRDEKYLSIDDDDQLGNGGLLEEVVRKRFCFVDLGWSFRMTEFEGAMGIPQVKRIDEITEARRKNADYIIEGLGDLDVLCLPRDRPDETRRVYRMFPIRVDGSADMRNKLSFYLERNGVETRPLVPLLSQPYYRRLFGDIVDDYPVAKTVGETGFYIGCHEYLERADLDYAIQVIRDGVGRL